MPTLSLRSPAAAAAALALGALACGQAATLGLDTEPDQEARASAADFDHEHALWTEVLKAHVKGDGVDYAALKRDPSGLESYLRVLHAVTPEQVASWTDDQRFAFWINVYNAHVIQKVVENYPLESIRDLDRKLGLESVFKQTFVPMRAFDPDGRDGMISPDEIENVFLRGKFEDARLHAAINCAAKSCPPLRDEAFVAARLDRQLDEQMRAFVADRSRNRLDAAENTAYVSEIFKWFAADFERDAGSVAGFLARFSSEEDAGFFRGAKIRYLDYDWDLNDASERSE